ncbi:hypothetical protein [Acidithiobacillus thiooxidans]|uniref:Uncharacterized protein n=1 Tax=Acidithiobacillus thiooxidans ATCC 19377 TaxID=637390 RepID=A0A5P9XQ79_ACITH|nr:hypothetical protein [Acidithiobacillus thiooxidans]QFX96171.1 hypothetical protein GCD22_01898 [Acidithiobacillus thiooxidans ATCC 19377]
MVARKATTNKPVLSRIRKHALYMAIAAAMSGTCLFSANASAAGLVTTTGVQALMATETVTGKSQTTVASIGPLTNESSSEQQSGLESNMDSSSLAVVPVNASLGSTIYSSNQDAENAVSGYLKNYEQQIADAVVGSMKSSGTEVQLGMFTYIQNVQIANPSGASPSKAQVYATVQVQPNGSYQFLGTNVNNDTLYLLYAIYQQSKDAAYLPAGWTVPYAGETRWELDQITEEGDTIQSAPVSIDGNVWHTIQDNGAYDGTETVTNGVEKINYDPGVESLMQNQIKALMNQYNASLAVVMYGEQVKVSRNSAGQPLTAISVNSRVLEKSCGSPSTFKNTGQYGYLLTEVENEYIVQPSGSYADAGQVQANTISPSENYTESASVPSGDNDSQLEPDVVFPIAPDAGDLINWQSGSPLPSSDYVYMAPITDSSGNGNTTTEINSAYGPINVCVSPNEDIITGPTEYSSGGCGKDGCWNPFTYYQALNIEPVQINGNPDNFVCGYIPGEYPDIQCAMEMDTTYYYLGTNPDWNYCFVGADITGGSSAVAGLPVGYALTQPSWGNCAPYVGPSTAIEESDYSYNPPAVNDFEFAEYPGANNSIGYDGGTETPAMYNCTPSGCTYDPPYSFYK